MAILTLGPLVSCFSLEGIVAAFSAMTVVVLLAVIMPMIVSLYRDYNAGNMQTFRPRLRLSDDKAMNSKQTVCTGCITWYSKIKKKSICYAILFYNGTLRTL